MTSISNLASNDEIDAFAHKAVAALAEGVASVTKQTAKEAAAFAEAYAPRLIELAKKAAAAQISQDEDALHGVERALKAIRVASIQEAATLGLQLQQESIQQLWSVFDMAIAMLKVVL